MVPGIILGYDAVGRAALNNVGNVGDAVEIRFHFRSFARLEIAGKWFKISDDDPWRVHLKLRKASEAADGINHNGDDDMNDQVWTDAGSSRARNHDGF